MGIKRRKKIRLVTAVLILAMAFSGCGNQAGKKSYEAGKKLYHEGKYEEAVKKFEEAVTKYTDKAEYYIAYGMALIENSDFKEAQIQFDKAISDKENQIVRENNKHAYRGKGIAYYKANEYKKAIKAFEKALKINESKDLDVDILYYKGDSEVKTGDYKSAVKTYGMLLEKRKSDGSVYVKKAQAEYLMGDLENATLDFDQAIKLDSNRYEVYFGKYDMLMEEGDKEGANEVLNQALTIKTERDEDYFNVAKIHFLQGDYTSAQKDLSEAAEKGFLEAYYFLGQISESDGNYTDAIANYEKYLKLCPDSKNAAVYNRMGLCFMTMEEYGKAKEAFSHGISLNDSSLLKELKTNEIASYERLGDFEAAYVKAQEFVKDYPNDEKMKKELDFIYSRTDRTSEEAAKGKNASDQKQEKEPDKAEPDAKGSLGGGNSSAG